MDMVWASFRTQHHMALTTLGLMLPLSMTALFTDPSSGLGVGGYHTEAAVDAPLEADEGEWV